MPARRKIKTVDLGEAAAHLVLAEGLDDGADYSCAIAGPTAERLLGAKLKNAKLSRTSARASDVMRRWRAGCDAARQMGAPHFALIERREGAPLRAVFLPVSRKDGEQEAAYILSAVTEAPLDGDIDG